MEFQDLIVQLRDDSKSYHFCRDGLKGVAFATSVLQCVEMLRENIMFCFESDYHQVIAENVEEWYKSWKWEFNQCGIWVNECPDGGKGIVIITGIDKDVPNETLDTYEKIIIGNCHAFIFGGGKVKVTVFDHARIHSKNPKASLLLTNHSQGFVEKSTVTTNDFAVCYAEESKVYLDGHSVAHVTPSCKVTHLSPCCQVHPIARLGIQ